LIKGASCEEGKMYNFFSSLFSATDVNILQEAPIKPQANAACVKYYGTYIDKTFLCAGGDEKDSCQVKNKSFQPCECLSLLTAYIRL
jgi:hypothetical protein